MSVPVSGEARAVLRSGGWAEGRQVDLKPIAAFLSSRGFQLNAVAAEFLAEYHGLKLEPSNRRAFSVVQFDVFEEVAWLQDDDKPFLEGIAGASACPIGLATMAWLFATADGELFVLNDQWLQYTVLPSIGDGLDWLFGIRPDAPHATVTLLPEQKPPEFR